MRNKCLFIKVRIIKCQQETCNLRNSFFGNYCKNAFYRIFLKKRNEIYMKAYKRDLVYY